MEYLNLFVVDKVVPIASLIAVSICFRWLLEICGQRWITTYAQTATLTVLPVITYVITKVISGNIALSLGMVGALSIVRFRNPVRSPLELSVYFGAITMGIAASVSFKWFVFFVASIALAVGSLVLVSFLSKALFGRMFFNTSFSEGNSLSTLEVVATESIDILDCSRLLKSKSVDNKSTEYLMVSGDFATLKQVVTDLKEDKRIISYQLTA